MKIYFSSCSVYYLSIDLEIRNLTDDRYLLFSRENYFHKVHIYVITLNAYLIMGLLPESYWIMSSLSPLSSGLFLKAFSEGISNLCSFDLFSESLTVVIT